MMLKLQRLQQKAVMDDDYDAGEPPPTPPPPSRWPLLTLWTLNQCLPTRGKHALLSRPLR